MLEREFNKCLLESVDETLSTLGDSSKQAIYYHLKMSFHIEKRKIPTQIAAFANAMENIFGFGANSLETQIIKRLYKKLGRKFEGHIPRTTKFVDYIESARRRLAGSIKKTEEGFIQWEENIIET